MIDRLIGFCLDHTRTVLLVLILLLVSGTVAYVTIPKESDPDISLGLFIVTMTHEGISPEDAERLLIRPMETELRGVEGLKEMTAVAREGYASITLEFHADIDTDVALADVREQVDLAKAELPAETEEPIVTEISFSNFPVLTVVLSGNIPERALSKTARDLRDLIEGIPSVLEAPVSGDREEVVEILVDPQVLETYHIDQSRVFDLIRGNNLLVAAGNLDNGAGRIPVKVPGLFEQAWDILDTPIRLVDEGIGEGPGKVIRMRDVATIRKTFKDREVFARVDGRPAITLEVKKRAGENIIETIEQVRALVKEESATWPEGMRADYIGDRSRDIRTMLTDLQNNVLSAVFLVMVVVVAALGWRTGLLVGIAIPGSFLTGILVLSIMGLTVNIVVLFALILAVGMLVDGAIVVTEFADRKMNEGQPRFKAYKQAAQRMALPIIASTVTTLAAFAPLLFWPGIVGEFMRFMPLTLIAVLSASLVMALIFVPALGSLFGKPGPASGATMKSLAAAEGGDLKDLGGFTGWYVRTLDKVLGHPWKVVGVAVLSLFGVYFIYGAFGRGVEFFPDVEPEQMMLFVRARGDMSVQEYDRLVRQVEQEILAMETGEFRSVYVNTAVEGGRGGGAMMQVPEDAHGIFTLEFADWEQRRPADAILAEIRERTKDIPGIIIEEFQPNAGPPTGKDVQVQLTSRFPEKLEPALEKILAHMETMEGLKDINDTRAVPGIEWAVQVDRAQAGRYGADIALVGNTVQLVTNGLNVGTYRPDDADDEIDIRVRYPEAYRSLDQIERLRVFTAPGLVPIGNFVTYEPQAEVGKVERVDSRRFLTATANAKEGFLPDTLVGELREWIENEAHLDPAVRVQFRGQDEEQAESQAFLMKAFLVALFVMGIILVTQFNSFYEAFLILTAVVFSTVGVFLGLLITHQPFGIVMNGIGVIALAGIVVNNNIVLIDTFDLHLKNIGGSVRDAVLRTCAQRLRPIMLTTVTTILGLTPMVLSMNIDFLARDITMGAPSTQWWNQLATSVAFGLAFATLLTLVLTPSLLVLGGKMLQKKVAHHGHLAVQDIEPEKN